MWMLWHFWGFFYVIGGRMALCVQIDFTRTFEANTKCNNKNHVWSHYYKFLVVLKYHRHPWVNIFDTDISRCINTYIKVVYLAFFGILMLLQMSVSKTLAQGSMVHTSKLLKVYRNDFDIPAPLTCECFNFFCFISVQIVSNFLMMITFTKGHLASKASFHKYFCISALASNSP